MIVVLMCVLVAYASWRLWRAHVAAVQFDRDAARGLAAALGHNGLPICQCEKPKDVVPDGQPRFTGWCGHCGKDLACPPASKGSK